MILYLHGEISNRIYELMSERGFIKTVVCKNKLIFTLISLKKHLKTALQCFLSYVRKQCDSSNETLR